jgi:hypothetical protein
MIELDFHPTERQLRQFGWFSLVGFPAIGWLILHLWHGFSADLAWVFTGIGVAIWAASLIAARLVKPIFVGLMVIAVPIGIVISTLALGLIYYGLFTPVALLFKLRRRDKLALAWDAKAPTYWVERKTDIPPSRYLRMY